MLFASAATRLLSGSCGALALLPAPEASEILCAAAAVAPAVPAELWQLRRCFDTKQGAPELALLLHLGSQVPVILRRSGSVVGHAGAQSLCARLVRASVAASTVHSGTSGPTTSEGEGSADVDGVLALIDHTTAALASGNISEEEPGLVIDLPLCMLVLAKRSQMVVRALPRVVALVSALARICANKKTLLSLITVSCALCESLMTTLPPRTVKLNPAVLRGMRCFVDAPCEGTLRSCVLEGSTSDSSLDSWLEEGRAHSRQHIESVQGADADQQLLMDVPGVPGVPAWKTGQAELAALRLLRHVTASSGTVAERSCVQSIARRFLSEVQNSAGNGCEDCGDEMNELSKWIVQNWEPAHQCEAPPVPRSTSLNIRSCKDKFAQRSNSQSLDGSVQNAKVLKRSCTYDMLLRLRSSSVPLNDAAAAPLLELLFTAQSLDALREASQAAQSRWLRWIQAATHLEGLFAALASPKPNDSGPALARSISAPISGHATNVDSLSPTVGDHDASEDARALALLRCTEAACMLFSCWGSPTWCNEMPTPVAEVVLARARRLLAVVFEVPMTNAKPLVVNGHLPLMTVAAVLGAATAPGKELLAIACPELAENSEFPSKAAKTLQEAAWAAYLCTTLFGPRSAALAQIQESLPLLCKSLGDKPGKERDDWERGADGEPLLTVRKQSSFGNAYACNVVAVRVWKGSLQTQGKFQWTVELEADAHGDGDSSSIPATSSKLIVAGHEFSLMKCVEEGGRLWLTYGGEAPESGHSPRKRRQQSSTTRDRGNRASAQDKELVFVYGGSSASLAWPRPQRACEGGTIRASMLATGEAPCSPAVAVAELLIIFRRLLDATPCKVTLELPGELEHEPALQALALSAVGVAVRDGAALPLSQSTALAPLATSVAEGGETALWRSLAAAARVRIWQELLPSGTAALVEWLQLERPGLALAALAVLGCRQEAPVSGAEAHARLKHWNPPPGLTWATPLEAPPPFLDALPPAERCALLRAVLALLRKVGDTTRPMSMDGVPMSTVVKGELLHGHRCGRVCCLGQSPCAQCLRASRDSGLPIEDDMQKESTAKLVAKFCDGGHELKEMIPGKDASYEMHTCNVCEKRDIGSSEPVFRCETCDYDLCVQCLSRPSCPKGHALKNVGSSASDGWVCSNNAPLECCMPSTRYRCSVCDYDLCENCHKSKHESARSAVDRSGGGGEITRSSSSSADVNAVVSQLLTVQQVNDASLVWSHASIVAVLLIRSLEPSPEFLAICESAAKEALDMANAIVAAEASDVTATEAGELNLVGVHSICGLDFTPSSCGTWHSWRQAVRKQLSEGMTVTSLAEDALSFPEWHCGDLVQVQCLQCHRKMRCKADVQSVRRCVSCGKCGVEWECSDSCSASYCGRCVCLQRPQVTPSRNGGDSEPQCGLCLRVLPALLTALCAHQAERFAGALEEGHGWAVLRLAVQDECPMNAESPWRDLAAKLPPQVLEAETVADLLAAVLSRQIIKTFAF